MVVTLGRQYNFGEKPTVILFTYSTSLNGVVIIYDDSAIEPYNNRGLYSKHKERYDITISEEWCSFVLQQVRRDVLPCHLFRACLYFTLFVRVAFVTAG